MSHILKHRLWLSSDHMSLHKYPILKLDSSFWFNQLYTWNNFPNWGIIKSSKIFSCYQLSNRDIISLLSLLQSHFPLPVSPSRHITSALVLMKEFPLFISFSNIFPCESKKLAMTYLMSIWPLLGAWRFQIATHHATKHNTPIHNILSTAPQLSISQKTLGTLPEDGNVISKHVGATIHN
jgi:hypothetical protein